MAGKVTKKPNPDAIAREAAASYLETHQAEFPIEIRALSVLVRHQAKSIAMLTGLVWQLKAAVEKKER